MVKYSRTEVRLWMGRELLLETRRPDENGDSPNLFNYSYQAALTPLDVLVPEFWLHRLFPSQRTDLENVLE